LKHCREVLFVVDDEAVARRFGYAEPVAATTLKARTGS
jgi:hypothetical protein